MRVLVVAGTGFIGGHVARAFVARGDDVRALVRSEVRAAGDSRLRGTKLVVGTLGALPEQVLDEAPDVVVYAAGVWRRDDASPPEEIARRCEEVYVRGVSTLAERALAWKAHFVLVSGISRYGDIAWHTPLREDAPPGALSSYGAYKRRSEAILKRLGQIGLRWTAIVPHEVYGAHDPGGYVRFVYERVLRRRFVLLGSGENRWAVCNVKNVAALITHVSDRDGVGPLHVADAQPPSQKEIATALARALDRRAWFARVPRRVALAAARFNTWIPRPAAAAPPFSPAHVRFRTMTMLLDTTRARALGFEPSFALEDGISEAVAWWANPG